MTTVQLRPESETPETEKVVWFPLFWDLTDRRVVVVGGGKTAEDKIRLLLEARAAVVVVTPTASDEIAGWAGSGRLEWIAREFLDGDLEDAALAIAATDDPVANTHVFDEAESAGIPINAVDDPKRCSVIFPATHRDGPLVVAVSTSGAAPAVAVRLRDQIAAMTAGYGRWLAHLRGFRRQIRHRFATFELRRAVWYRIVDSTRVRDAARVDDDRTTDLVQEEIDAFARTRAPQPITILSKNPPLSTKVASADKRIAAALAGSERPLLTCSMQLGGLVLLDRLRKFIPDIPVVFVDTGYHFPETIAFRDRVSADWNLNLVVAEAATSVDVHESEHGLLYETDPRACCAARKVAPAEGVIAEHDLWFAAVRRSQGGERGDVAVGTDHPLPGGIRIRKVHPIADWSWSDVEEYADAHGIPRHPLYDQGYSSIGCAPCTIPTFVDDDGREGRWVGLDMTECGLHLPGRKREVPQ